MNSKRKPVSDAIERRFVAYFWFIGWEHWSLGLHVHIDRSRPNLEIHLPGGFIRIGWVSQAAYVPRAWRWLSKPAGIRGPSNRFLAIGLCDD